jgi:hopanoid-associated phosphorylase
VIDPAQIGILTGLDLEASLIAAAVPHASLAVAPIVAMSGGDPARARAEAARLVERGCALLLSYGFAGALEPRLKPGTIVVPERVVSEDGGIWTIDRARCDRLVSALVHVTGRQAVARGTVLGSDHVLATRGAKTAAHDAHGAVAVDMESHALAAAASAAGRAFAVLRVVLDPARQAIPSAAMAGLRKDGSTAVGPIALALLRRPHQLPSLLRLGLHSRRARAALAAATAAALRALRDG